MPATPAPTAASPLRRHGRTLLQCAVAVIAMTWLWQSGKLDLSLLKSQLAGPTLILWTLIYATVNLLSTLRWYWFCRRAGLPLGGAEALRMMMVGLFWGIFTPGLVGIDVSRAYLMARKFPGQAGPATLTVVADRLMIVIATLLLSALALPWTWPLAVAHPALLTMALGTFAAGLGLIGGMALLLYAPVERLPWLQRLVAGRLARTDAALQLFRAQPGVLVSGLGLALISQLLTIALIGILLSGDAGGQLSWATLGLIVPIGWHAMSLPVAPAGLGVGQVAFDQLFVWAGCVPGIGATAATTYQTCLIGFHLLMGLALLWPESAPATAGQQG